MEQEEFQNEISESILKSMEAGDGIDLGRGERDRNGNTREVLPPRRMMKNLSTDNRNDLTDVATTSVPRPTTFAKVEKSLASLGFFTHRQVAGSKIRK